MAFRAPVDLDALNALSAGNLVGHLGIMITEAGEDWLRGTMPVEPRTHQPFGLLHGGASVVLAESLGSLAGGLSVIDPERFGVVGLEINANHIRGERTGMVTGTARAVHIGRTTQVWDIRIENARGKPVCVSRLTLAVVPKPAD
ncbi:hotdog fold thioesterase [Pseudoxanthomonas sp. JBR18]|uniref:hotdog fold thioesterase n=1 Tax=Pseudoxanthomonas sp. JBR18 TaxID=2969308 RepID=UPI0023052416|nr:hotdog fold thioesterase [Pseudoxanthomonas sp. JBR18]WCE06087.1 hotdog fold thioesterase [Pseudoxanthomonas sp. JBR18]